MKTAFVITIDTEGDNIWASGSRVTTENARYLPRFQRLCEEYGFKPTYLTNYEMAIDPAFQKLGRAGLEAGTAEIGLHIHPWDSPPLDPADAGQGKMYLFELSDASLNAKIEHMTRLLVETFDIQPVSHRAGRWGFDARVARALVDHAYRIDCSVAPGASYTACKGRLDGNGGPDYFGYPQDPYFLSADDIRRPGDSPMLEVPLTTRQNYPAALDALHHSVRDSIIGKVVRRVAGPAQTWLRPNGHNLDGMLSLIDWATERAAPVLEFMLHSSELMPEGSPNFVSAEDIEALYGHLERLFSHAVDRGAVGNTLAEFYAAWGDRTPTSRSPRNGALMTFP
jgi:hypothetical protein